MKTVRNRLISPIVCSVFVSLLLSTPSSLRADGVGARALSWAEWFSALSRAAVVRLVPHSYDTEKTSTKTCVAVDSVRATNELLALINHRNEAWTARLYNGAWLAYDVAMLTQHIKALAEQGDEQSASVDEEALSPEAAGSLQEAIDWLSWGLPWVEYVISIGIAAVTSDETTTYRVRLQSILSLSRMLQVWIAQRHTPMEQWCGILVAAHLILTVSEFFRNYNPSPSQNTSLAGGETTTPIQQPISTYALPVATEDGTTATSSAGQSTVTDTQASSGATTAVVAVQTPLVQGAGVESEQKRVADEKAALAVAANTQTPVDIKEMLASLPPLPPIHGTSPMAVASLTPQQLAEIDAAQKAEELKVPETENVSVEKDEEVASSSGSDFGALSAMVGGDKDAKSAKEPSVDPMIAAQKRYNRKVALALIGDLPARLKELAGQIAMARNRQQMIVAAQMNSFSADDTAMPITDTGRREALNALSDTEEIRALIKSRDECAKMLADATAELAEANKLPELDRYQRMQLLDQRMRSAERYKGHKGTPVPTLVIDCSRGSQSSSANSSDSSASSASGSTPAA